MSATDIEVGHGFTLTEVDRLAVFAVRRYFWRQPGDFHRRLDVARFAIVTRLCSGEEKPAAPDLVRLAWTAINTQTRRDRMFHGLSTDDRFAGTTRAFECYWWSTMTATPSPETGVVDRAALQQIWPRLRPLHRQVLAALAAHDDYGRAAASLGKSRRTFVAQVSQARRAFLELWHEGEQPSRPWGRDRRKDPESTHPRSIALVLRRRTGGDQMQ